MTISLNEMRINILKFILVLMPLHVLIFNLVNFQPLTLWRDILILFLVLGVVFRRIKQEKYIVIVIMRTIICLFFAVIFHDSSMSASIWINVLRVYLFPALIIIVLGSSKISHEHVRKMCRLYVIEAFFISVFGIFQMFVIGRSYLQLIGVGQSSVLLADGTQRNISVFESANVLAIYLVFAIILLIQCKNIIKKKRNKWIVMLGLLAGLVLTYSMSAFLVLAILAVIKVSTSDYSHLSSSKMLKFFLVIVIGFLAALIFILSNPEILILLKMQLEEKITDIISTLTGTNTISTSSAAIHYRDFIEGFQLLGKNLNGLGFAKESFMVSDKVFNRALVGLKESSYLTIMYDFGVFVGIIYLLPYIFLLVSWKNKENTRGRETAKFISMTVVISYLFLPVIQSYELTFFTFFFIGLLYYSSEKTTTN